MKENGLMDKLMERELILFIMGLYTKVIKIKTNKIIR